MELRASLTPPDPDPAVLSQLSRLVKAIDGVASDRTQADVEAFNELAGTSLTHADFQGYFAAQSAEDFAFEQFIGNAVATVPDVSREELVEVLRRSLAATTDNLRNGYFAVLRANGAERAISLAFWPPDWDASLSARAGGRAIADYNPTPDEIIDMALTES